jgi:DNA topoisomerase-3
LKIEKNDIDNKKQIVNFNWKRERLFNKLITTTIFEKILDSKECKVTKIKQNPKTRLRPIPLNTVEMTKLISKKLHINSNDTMTIAENLYRKGLISYPRTETQKYKKTELPQL